MRPFLKNLKIFCRSIFILRIGKVLMSVVGSKKLNEISKFSLEIIITERFNQCFSKSFSLENLVFISYFMSKAFYGKMLQVLDLATFSKYKK